MCNELESFGLPAPEYRCNAFILQTIVRNSKKIEASATDCNAVIEFVKPISDAIVDPDSLDMILYNYFIK